MTFIGRRLLFALGTLLGACFVLVSGSPAGAEIDSNSQTRWGLQTPGPSRTQGSWNSLAWDIEQIGNTIYVGGKFLHVTNGSGLNSQPFLAAFDADTGAWQSWFRPQVGATVLALEATPDGGLLVGGEIDNWNGQTVGALVKIDPATGQMWPGWSTRVYGGNSAIYDLKLEDDGWVYAVGSFTTVSRAGFPEGAAGAIRFDPITGVIDPNWKPALTGGSGRGVSRSKVNSTIYISGTFLGVNGLPNTSGFVGVNPLGAVTVNRSVVPLNGCTTPNNAYCFTMYDVEATDTGLLFVGGVEHAMYVLDETDNFRLRYHHYTGCDPSRNERCQPANWYGGEFQEIYVHGDRVYASCHCWHDHFSHGSVIPHGRPPAAARHSTLSAMAAYDTTTGARIESFRPHLTGDAGGWAFHVNPSDGCLWAGGGFQSVGQGNQQRSARDLVRLCDSAGPGPAAQPAAVVPTPASCALTNEGTLATLTWSTGAGTDAVIIERSINGGNWNWRARIDTPETQFSEDVPANGTTAYRIRAAYRAGQQSERIPCGEPINLVPELRAPASCSVSVANPGGANSPVTVSWVAGNQAAAHVVYRSVDGSVNHWRARAEMPALSFTDSVTTGPSYQYAVAARSSAGALTELVPCGGPVQLAPIAFAAPPSCSASAADGVATISWGQAPGAGAYIVYRSVNGAATEHWRGRVEAPDTTFADPVANGSRYQYLVASRSAAGQLSERVPCTPELRPGVVELVAVASCRLTIEGNAVTVDWVPGGETFAVIVERSSNGTTWSWRGRVDGPGTSFDDELRAGLDWTYRVVARDGPGTRSEPTTCV